jgi:hypothetical protein
MASEAPEIVETETPQEEVTPTPVSGVVVAHGVDITDRRPEEAVQFYDEAGPAFEAEKARRLTAIREKSKQIIAEEEGLQGRIEAIG